MNNLRFTLLIFFSCLFFSLNAAKQPKLKFDTEVVDFGLVERNKTYTKKLSFKNVGKSKLVFLRYSSSCGCTTVKTLPPQSIIPKDTCHIDVEFDTSIFYSGESVTKYLTFFTNDKNSPHKIKVIAKIK